MTSSVKSYCKLSPEDMDSELRRFLSDVTKLPDLSLSEVTNHAPFDAWFEPFVNERVRWRTLAKTLRELGWHRYRNVSRLYYVGPGDYQTRNASRWTPPTPPDSHDS